MHMFTRVEKYVVYSPLGKYIRFKLYLLFAMACVTVQFRNKSYLIYLIIFIQFYFVFLSLVEFFEYKIYLTIHFQNGCVVFDKKCVMPKLYKSNWCVIFDTLTVSHKNIKSICFGTPLSKILSKF